MKLNIKSKYLNYFFASAFITITLSSNLLAEESADKASAWKPGTRHELAEDLTMAGSLRSRYEVKRDFKFDDSAPGNNDDYILNQIRLNLKWDPSKEVSFFVEGQSSDISGEDAVDENARPNIFSDEFDLHQAYADVSFEIADTDSKLRLGRQKFNFGDQRLVGAFEWSNTARVFDAVSLTVGKATEKSATIFTSRAIGVDPNNFNDWSKSGNRYADSTFHGVYYSDKESICDSTLDLYYLYRDQSDFNDNIHTFGSRFATKADNLDFTGELAYQFGEYGSVDHSAFAAHADAGITFEEAYKTRVGLAYNYGSGDDDSTDSKHHTFDNLYPTNHLHYGYMDFFSLQNMHNLELTTQSTLVEDLALRLAYQNFWLAEEDTDSWYNAGLGSVRTATTDVNSYVGSELDITFRYTMLAKRLALEATYGHFFASSYVSDTGSSNDADVLYLMAKLEI